MRQLITIISVTLAAPLVVNADAIRQTKGDFYDAFPEQVNQVNLLLGDSVRTVTFAGDDTWKTVVLDNPM